MKKYALIFLLQFVVSYSFAQWSVGVTGGVNYTGMSFPASTLSSTTYSSSTSLKAGFNAGVILESTFGNFSFQPSLLYTTIGGKFNSRYLITSPTGGQYQLVSRDYTLNYLQVPLNLVYNFPIKMGKLFLGAGPYVSFNLSGTDKFMYTEPDGQTSGGTDQISTKYEIGVDGVFGLELKNGLFFKANYKYGSNSILTYSDENIHNYGASLSIGFFIKKAKPKDKSAD